VGGYRKRNTISQTQIQRNFGGIEKLIPNSTIPSSHCKQDVYQVKSIFQSDSLPWHILKKFKSIEIRMNIGGNYRHLFENKKLLKAGLTEIKFWGWEKRES